MFPGTLSRRHPGGAGPAAGQQFPVRAPDAGQRRQEVDQAVDAHQSPLDAGPQVHAGDQVAAHLDPLGADIGAGMLGRVLQPGRHPFLREQRPRRPGRIGNEAADVPGAVAADVQPVADFQVIEPELRNLGFQVAVQLDLVERHDDAVFRCLGDVEGVGLPLGQPPAAADERVSLVAGIDHDIRLRGLLQAVLDRRGQPPGLTTRPGAGQPMSVLRPAPNRPTSISAIRLPTTRSESTIRPLGAQIAVKGLWAAGL